jgi:hypothetical protein
LQVLVLRRKPYAQPANAKYTANEKWLALAAMAKFSTGLKEKA